MLDEFTRPGQRLTVRGEVARAYLIGALHYTARHEADLPLLVPRALGWFARLVELGVIVPFGVVLDLGYLLLDGDAFRFRRLASLGVDPAERRIRESYESACLVRRLEESNFRRLRRLLLDHPDADLAVSRTLELMLRPVAEKLTCRLGLETPHASTAELGRLDPAAACEAFEAAVARPGLLLSQVAEVAAQADSLDLDRRLAAEDFYELQHIRQFARESLREVARRIGRVERLLGPPRRASTRTLRARALAETALEAVGTYPTGGIAELCTTGPIENLVPSELAYLEPGQPIDPFVVRFAEGELLRWLRDSAVHRMMRRTVVFVIEDAAAFATPVSAGGELRGTKIIRCLMGLVLTLTADLLAIFRKDDLSVDLRLVAGDEEPAETRTERQEILEVLHLLLREKEEQGTASVERLSTKVADYLSRLPRDAQRQVTVVAIGRYDTVRPLAGQRPAGAQVVPVAVGAPDDADAAVLSLRLDSEPLAALQATREAVLERMTA